MNTSRLLLTTVCAAVTFVATQATAASWPVADQPALKQAITEAPVLKTESLGEPARGVNVWERWMVPNRDGKSWDVLQIYFKEYYGPTWLAAIDLGTGKVNLQRLADDHQWYLSGRALGFDGKYYIAVPSRKTGNMDLYVYNPDTNKMEERGQIVEKLFGELRPLVLGPDGRLYGSSTRDNQINLYIYDPKSSKMVKDYGTVGPVHPNGAWCRGMGVDDQYAYLVSGDLPAVLISVNLKTGQTKTLFEQPHLSAKSGSRLEVLDTFPGAEAIVPNYDGAGDKRYWLYHGKAIVRNGDNMPWPKRKSPWDKAAPRPEVYYDQIDPDLSGNATLWYRSQAAKVAREKAGRGGAAKMTAEALGWKAVHIKDAKTYPQRINPLCALPDGRLYGTGDNYVGTFLFDPKTDQTTYCGPRTGNAPYTAIVCGDKYYFCGYAGGPLYVYDPSRPWNMGKGGPPTQPAHDNTEPASNPRRIGSFEGSTRIAIMHSSAIGADGKIYFGGFGERSYTGGGFGWYDPKTGKLDGFWKPLSGYGAFWLAPVNNGKQIVISTATASDELKNHRFSEEAKLFVYDVAKQKIVREIVPIKKARTTGLITEVAPGRLLGLTIEGAEWGKPRAAVLYGVDVDTGDVLFRKPLPSTVSIDDYWPHWVDPSYEYNSLTLAPDGFVWTFLKDVLVRIDPKDASVHVVGKLDPVGHPTFVGSDVYFSGPEQLRRIRNIVPTAGARAKP